MVICFLLQFGTTERLRLRNETMFALMVTGNRSENFKFNAL